MAFQLASCEELLLGEIRRYQELVHLELRFCLIVDSQENIKTLADNYVLILTYIEEWEDWRI